MFAIIRNPPEIDRTIENDVAYANAPTPSIQHPSPPFTPTNQPISPSFLNNSLNE